MDYLRLINYYLFSSYDNGHLYCLETALRNFPIGMSSSATAISDSDISNLSGVPCVYNLGNGTYVLIVEPIGGNHR